MLRLPQEMRRDSGPQRTELHSSERRDTWADGDRVRMHGQRVQWGLQHTSWERVEGTHPSIRSSAHMNLHTCTCVLRVWRLPVAVILSRELRESEGWQWKGSWSGGPEQRPLQHQEKAGNKRASTSQVEKAEQFHSSRMGSEREEMQPTRIRGALQAWCWRWGGSGEVLKQGTGVVRYVS